MLLKDFPVALHREMKAEVARVVEQATRHAETRGEMSCGAVIRELAISVKPNPKLLNRHDAKNAKISPAHNTATRMDPTEPGGASGVRPRTQPLAALAPPVAPWR